MGYVDKTWIHAEVVNADKMNNTETGIKQNNLFNLLLTPGRYKTTVFNLDESITESIKLTIDDSTYATLTTTFDDPAATNITTTLVCTALSINNKVVTVFNIDESITETSSEVV